MLSACRTPQAGANSVIGTTDQRFTSQFTALSEQHTDITFRLLFRPFFFRVICDTD